MNTLLKLAEWLEAQYLLHLNVKLDRLPEVDSVALWVLDGEAERVIGMLLDADLGVWFKFIVIDSPGLVQDRVDSEVMAALNDSSQLLWKNGMPEGTADKNGAWNVTLVFLVQKDCQSAWDVAIQKLRSQSGFTEEIAIDAVFYEDEVEFCEQLKAGAALPHLLFHTRKLLQLPIDELDTWNSADSEVAKLMEVLPGQFDDPEDRRLVDAMVLQVRKADANLAKPSAVSAPLRIGTLTIADTRNISDFVLPLMHPDHDVLAQIIYGPNGTGKSSIFEALSFAVAKSSRRMRDYINDKDENANNPPAAKYVENVLRPLDSTSRPDVRIVRKECVAIVDRHLPQTLQAVWTELTMAMTPARWNLSGRPTMLATDVRSANSLKVVVGEGSRLIGVRHIFNQAEAHVLGLAWFFTRYLSYGRARHALMALDDPAQEMDQTTFRSFTRFLQTICRLHERHKIPLTLVLLLHQEDRALDAARATNHQLTTLRWAKKISSAASVEHVILMAPGFGAPLPKKLRRTPSSSAQVAV